jgi:hypothetical protein
MISETKVINYKTDNNVRVPGTIKKLYINTPFKLCNNLFVFTGTDGNTGIEKVSFSNFLVWNAFWFDVDENGEQKAIIYKT